MTSADIIAAAGTTLRRAHHVQEPDGHRPVRRGRAGRPAGRVPVPEDDPRLQFDILNCISGVDYLEPDPKKAPKAGFDPHLEVVYHLSSFRHRHRFVLKVILPRWKDDKPGELPEVPSVTSLWRTADWHEREVYDLCGVCFTAIPNLTRILLADDWEGYPLRKDYEFPLEYHGIRGR